MVARKPMREASVAYNSAWIGTSLHRGYAWPLRSVGFRTSAQITHAGFLRFVICVGVRDALFLQYGEKIYVVSVVG